MSNLHEAALRYADLGYPVFPCASGTKHPLTEHGFHDASSDLDQIDRWWTLHPTANIGLATTGLVVIDVDGRENPWLADQSERAAELAQGAVCTTPRGGRHYYFRQPEGDPIRCSAGRLAPGVDVRAAGGYVLLPPSAVNSKPYQWVTGLELDHPLGQLPLPPTWLVDPLARLATSPAVLAQGGTSENGSNEIPSGQRNATLARLAGTMRRVGMSQAEISAALNRANQDRCALPLPAAEVERIAANVARYEPDQVATAIAEDHWAQMQKGGSVQPPLVPLSLADLTARYTDLRQPVIHGLLRQGETMNVISAPKIGKSWLVIDLALAIATGRTWMDTFAAERGNVLIIDNELHGETSANRIPKVAAARRIPLEDVGRRLFVQNLRGQLLDIFSLGAYFRSLERGRFKVIILDAFYRFMPVDTDENDNGAMAHVYNRLDRYADDLDCCFVLIHHTSKGNQSGKTITDVGAGAGSQSRATDTHLVLRPHEEEDAVVLDAAVRSWPPVQARCLRWTFPVWTPTDDLDPALLRSERPRRPRKVEQEGEEPLPELPWDAQRFVDTFITAKPKSRELILGEATAAGLSDRRAERLLRQAEAAAVAHRWVSGRNRPSSYANIPQPRTEGNVE